MYSVKHVSAEDAQIRYSRKRNAYMNRQTLFQVDIVHTKAPFAQDKPINNVLSALSADDVSPTDWQAVENTNAVCFLSSKRQLGIEIYGSPQSLQ